MFFTEADNPQNYPFPLRFLGPTRQFQRTVTLKAFSDSYLWYRQLTVSVSQMIRLCMLVIMDRETNILPRHPPPIFGRY